MTERRNMSAADKVRLIGELMIELADDLEAGSDALAEAEEDAADGAALADFRARKAAGTLVGWPAPVVDRILGKRRLHPLRAWREWRGLGQQALAGFSGITVSAISDIETGKTERPHPDTLKRLADALDCEPEQLLPIETAGA